MAFWAYILKCVDGRYYTGHTDNIEQRLAQHQAGGYCDFTSRRLPVQLVSSDYFQTRLEAIEAEMKIKPWSRAKKEALIAGDWAKLSYFAKPPKERGDPSTSLGTNGALKDETKGTSAADLPVNPFVPSAVEGSTTDLDSAR